MVTFRKPKLIKDILVMAKVPISKQDSKPNRNRLANCWYCTRMSHTCNITRLDSYHPYYTIIHGNWPSNNLIYCLEYNICPIKYVSQTKNRILDTMASKCHLFDIRNHKNTTVARHFANHGKTYSPPITIHFLEYIKVSKDVPRSESLREKREISWINRLNPLFHNSLNIIDWYMAPQKTTKGLN